MLDEERREAFLQALQSLQDEQKEVAKREREVQRREEEQLQRDIEEARRRRAEDEERENQLQEQERQERASVRTASSEVDYGIEPQRSHPNGSANGSTKGRSMKGINKSSRSGATVSHSSRPSVSGSKAVTPTSFVKRAGAIIANLRKLLEAMAANFTGNPMMLLRTLAFIVALLLVLSRRDVKERLRSIMGKGWGKVRATAGMGVKVSYI